MRSSLHFCFRPEADDASAVANFPKADRLSPIAQDQFHLARGSIDLKFTATTPHVRRLGHTAHEPKLVVPSPRSQASLAKAPLRSTGADADCVLRGDDGRRSTFLRDRS